MAVTTETREKAILMRKDGGTYKEISCALNISIDWCKRNLKHVTPSPVITRNECIDELISLATRKGGVSIYEASSVIFRYYPDEILSKDKLRVS